MKTKFLFLTILCLFSMMVQANDGVVFVQGNQLVPLKETDISVAKEVLIISIGDDGYAKVDVQYEFMNHGKAKTVEMGFEAEAPYNDEAQMNMEGKHPYIYDFTVTMNDKPLAYKNSVILSYGEDNMNFEPLDLKKWKVADDIGLHLVRYSKTDSIMPFAYAYYFTAPFKEGLNKVHHTYRYRLSYGVGRTFEVPYWLKPAMRWANRQIDDFTLRIKAEKTAKHFCFSDSLFAAAPFKVVDGMGKMRKVVRPYDGEYLEVALRNGTLEWHAKNFVPRANLMISAADLLSSFSETEKLGTFYDRSDKYRMWSFDGKKKDGRILRNLPYANRGYVFKDKWLNDYFNQLWWYMPDPTWQASSSDFTPREWKLIREGSKTKKKVRRRKSIRK